VSWREGTKGKMSSRFATRTCVLAQDDSLIPRSGKRSGCSWNGRMARRQRRTLPRPRCRRNMSRRQLVRRVKQRWRTERVYEDAKGELGLDHYEGRSFAAGTTMCPWCWFASRLSSRALQAFPPSAGKTATRKASHRHDGADGNPPGAGTSGIPSSLCAWPSRAWPHGYPDAPCVTDRDRWTACAHAREHRRTTPF